MTHEPLAAASDRLRQAAAATDGDVADRFEQEADALATAAADETEPDHGWLARHTHLVRDAADDANERAREHAEAAVEHINDYRENVPGV